MDGFTKIIISHVILSKRLERRYSFQRKVDRDRQKNVDWRESIK